MVRRGVKFLTWRRETQNEPSKELVLCFSLQLFLFKKRKEESTYNLIEKVANINCYQPQLPELQEPELHPPPEPSGLTEVIPKPDRGPAST